MNLLIFALKNLGQRKVRTLLTCVGIAVAVCAVVALVGLSAGFQTSIMRMFQKQGVDIVVLRKGTVQGMTSVLDEQWEGILAAVEGVQSVDPLMADLVSYPDSSMPAVQILGCRPGGRLYSNVTLLEGRLLGPEDRERKVIVLGKVLADNLQKKVGESMDVEGEPVPIVGIYTSSSQLETSSALMPLKALQRLTAWEGKVTGFVASVDPALRERGDDVAAVVARLNEVTDEEGKKLPVRAIDTKTHVSTTPEILLVNALVWATSLIALLLGGIGILNTMTTSVTTRTREIGVLRAVGWRRWRVAALVLTETMIQSAAGALGGAAAGVALTGLFGQLPATTAIVADVVNLPVIGWGVALALGAGLVGGLYPALMASRMLPSDALRHE